MKNIPKARPSSNGLRPVSTARGWRRRAFAPGADSGEEILRGAYRPGLEKIPAGMIEFYKDPEKYPMSTPSGKLEFYSERLAKNFPDDIERPPVPHWVEKSDFHDERISSERVRAYPLLVISNHPRWRSMPRWMTSTGPRDSHRQGQRAGRLSLRTGLDPPLRCCQTG